MYPKIYKVKKGKHRSTIGWLPFFRNRFGFTFCLGPSHNFNEATGQINKLYGFSDGALDHHKNSFRIGYKNTAGGTTELFSYQYIDDSRITSSLGFVPTNSFNNIEIHLFRGCYDIYVNGSFVAKAPRKNRSCWTYKHILFPYFGGKVPAPHDICHFIAPI